jgi:hypothetical protein
VQRPNTDDLAVTYNYWRRRYKDGWGLAWYLAAEFNERFYGSHAIRPEVIVREGLGYYGIGIQQRACLVVPQARTLGRFTMAGNVENWVLGAPGDHGLNLSERPGRGELLEALVQDAIRHLRLPILAPGGHQLCRHKRWGASSVLVFRLAALIALRWNDKVRIWNSAADVSERAAQIDPKRDMREHPGYLIISCGEHEVLFTGDGRLLKPAGCESVWERYMLGESTVSLLRMVEKLLGLAESVTPG